MKEEPIHIPSGDGTVFGIWTEPEGIVRLGATVITLHGWGGYRIGPHRMQVKLCRRLAEAGIASLRFDFRGRGDSTGEQSSATLDTMIEDATSAIDFARLRAPQNDITLWGICSGGNVAIGAATLADDVRHLILLSTLPFMPQKKAAEKIARTRVHASTYVKKLFRAATWKKLFSGAVNFANVKKALFGHYGKPVEGERDPKDSERDIMKGFARYAGEAHFVYGGADREAAGARGHYERFTAEQGIPATFETVEGSNHDYYSLDWERHVIELSLQWVKDRVE
jgi:dienelactone hydrolase